MRIDWQTEDFGVGEKFEYTIDPGSQRRETDPRGNYIVSKYLKDEHDRLACAGVDSKERGRALAQRWENEATLAQSHS